MRFGDGNEPWQERDVARVFGSPIAFGGQTETSSRDLTSASASH